MQNENFGTFVIIHNPNSINEIELLKEEKQKFKLEQLKQCQVLRNFTDIITQALEKKIPSSTYFRSK